MLGQEHPDTLISMAILAFIWKEQGRAAQAILLMERCVQLRKQVLSLGHLDTEVSLEALHTWKCR